MAGVRAAEPWRPRRKALAWRFAVAVLLACHAGTCAARLLQSSAAAPNTLELGLAPSEPVASSPALAGSASVAGTGLQSSSAGRAPLYARAHAASAALSAAAPQGLGAAASAAFPAAGDVRPLVLAQRRYARQPPQAQMVDATPTADASADLQPAGGSAAAAVPTAQRLSTAGSAAAAAPAVGAAAGGAADGVTAGAGGADAHGQLSVVAAPAAGAGLSRAEIANASGALQNAVPAGLPAAGSGAAAAPATAAAARSLPAVQAGVSSELQTPAAGGSSATRSGAAAAPAAAAAYAEGLTTGDTATGVDVGTNQTVTLLAPRAQQEGGARAEAQVAARNHTRRATAQHPNVGLPGGTYSQPQMGRMSASQLAALQARPCQLAHKTGSVCSIKQPCLCGRQQHVTSRLQEVPCNIVCMAGACVCDQEGA